MEKRDRGNKGYTFPERREGKGHARELVTYRGVTFPSAAPPSATSPLSPDSPSIGEPRLFYLLLNRSGNQRVLIGSINRAPYLSIHSLGSIFCAVFSRFNPYCIGKNASDGCPGIEREGRFQRRKAMGRYRL